MYIILKTSIHIYKETLISIYGIEDMQILLHGINSAVVLVVLCPLNCREGSNF